MRWAHLHQSETHKILHRLTHRSSCEGIFLRGGSLFSNDSGLCWGDIALAEYTRCLGEGCRDTAVHWTWYLDQMMSLHRCVTIKVEKDAYGRFRDKLCPSNALYCFIALTLFAMTGFLEYYDECHNGRLLLSTSNIFPLHCDNLACGPRASSWPINLMLSCVSQQP